MNHRDLIQAQFSRQAVPFSEARSMADMDAINLLIDAAAAQGNHTSLDIACGPGMVALAFARVVRRAVGLDTTRAMLERAQELQERQACRNVEWVLGEATNLPFPDAQFDIVTCRFAFHHMLEPAVTLREMRRVVRRGGRIVVCDAVASADGAKAKAFNAFERMRDPSTVRFLTADELRSLVSQSGLSIASERSYRVPGELEGLMRTSFPDPENVATLRRMLISSVDNDSLGLATRADGNRILFSYPALIFASHLNN